MYKLEHKDLIYYYSKVEYYDKAVEGSDLTKMQFADFAIDPKSNSFVKCRSSIESLMENFVQDIPKCICCGTRENIHKDGWYGYRCSSVDCMVF